MKLISMEVIKRKQNKNEQDDKCFKKWRGFNFMKYF